MRIAVLDLGTNTFHLLIAEKKGTDITVLLKEQKVVKLGEGGINSGIIAEAPFQRGIDAIASFKKTILKEHVDEVIAFATSAIRTARNGDAFLEKVMEETGIRIEKISGELEAEYIYEGVRQCVDLPPHGALIMDIGGGSTEFILANQKEIFWKHSYKLGAARLKDKFHFEDPLPEQSLQELWAELEATLPEMLEQARKHGITQLVGSAGSFDSLSEMAQTILGSEMKPVPNAAKELSLQDFRELYERVLKSTLAERQAMPGLASFRAEMMVMAIVLIKFVLDKLHIKEIIVSSYALKEGVLLKHFGGIT